MMLEEIRRHLRNEIRADEELIKKGLYFVESDRYEIQGHKWALEEIMTWLSKQEEDTACKVIPGFEPAMQSLDKLVSCIRR